MFPNKNHENLEIQKIRNYNHETPENLIIPCQKLENHQIRRNPFQNNENHEN